MPKTGRNRVQHRIVPYEYNGHIPLVSTDCSSIENLPEELLIKILSNLKQPSEIARAELVSKSFQRSCHQAWGRFSSLSFEWCKAPICRLASKVVFEVSEDFGNSFRREIKFTPWVVKRLLKKLWHLKSLSIQTGTLTYGKEKKLFANFMTSVFHGVLENCKYITHLNIGAAVVFYPEARHLIYACHATLLSILLNSEWKRCDHEWIHR